MTEAESQTMISQGVIFLKKSFIKNILKKWCSNFSKIENKKTN